MQLPKQIEKNTLHQLKKGDSKAFESVFRNWYEPLVHFADEYIKDQESAKNIVQNIFMLLWERHSIVDPDSNVRAFLYLATRNACLSHIRHLRVENSYLQKSLRNLEDLQLNYEALEELKIEQIDFAMLEKLINDTIESLPEKCRIVFEMSRFEELKNKEIAEKLGISVKAVEGHITRALVKIRSNTKEFLPEMAY